MARRRTPRAVTTSIVARGRSRPYDAVSRLRKESTARSPTTVSRRSSSASAVPGDARRPSISQPSAVRRAPKRRASSATSMPRTAWRPTPKTRCPRTASWPRGRTGARTSTTSAAPSTTRPERKTVRRTRSPPAAAESHQRRPQEEDDPRLDDHAGQEDGARLSRGQDEGRERPHHLRDLLRACPRERLLARRPRHRVARQVTIAEQVHVPLAREVGVADHHQAPAALAGTVARAPDLGHDHHRRLAG